VFWCFEPVTRESKVFQGETGGGTQKGAKGERKKLVILELTVQLETK